MLFLNELVTLFPSADATQRKALCLRADGLSDAHWMVENRWLHQQDTTTTHTVLSALRTLNVPLCKIHTSTLVQYYYTALRDKSTTPPLASNIGSGKRVYIMLLAHIYETESNPTVLEEMSQCVFGHIVSDSSNTSMLHWPFMDRGSILILFEKLLCVARRVSAKDGSATYHAYVRSLAYFNKRIVKEMRGYKKKLCGKMYNALIASMVKMAFMKGHFRNLDVLYANNKGTTRGTVQKLMLCASDADVQKIWLMCEHIRQFCADNVLKWKQIDTSSVLWTLCKSHLDSALLQLQSATGDSTVLLLATYTKRNIQKTFHVLQRYTRCTQRHIIQSYCQYISSDVAEKADKEYAQFFLNTYIRYVLMVNNYNKETLLFYDKSGYSKKELFRVLVPFTHVPIKMLHQWTEQFGPFPIAFLADYFHNIVQKESFTRLAFTLQCVEMALKTILEANTAGWDQSRSVMHAVAPFLVRFEESLKHHKFFHLRTFVRRLLINTYMHHSPAYQTVSNQPDSDGFYAHTTGACCSICYEETTEDLRVLQCGHCFHTHCMVEMVKHSEPIQTHIAKCPYCMTQLTMNGVGVLKEDSHVIIGEQWLLSHMHESSDSSVDLSAFY